MKMPNFAASAKDIYKLRYVEIYEPTIRPSEQTFPIRHIGHVTKKQ